MSRISLIAFLFFGSAQLEAKDWMNKLSDMLKVHCYDCHGDGTKKGGLAMDELSDKFEDPAVFAVWEQIYDRALNGEMPPKKVKDRTEAPPPPFDIETMEPIEPPWQAIKEWIPDDEPDLNWFNQERPPSDSEPDSFDQSPDWRPEEIPLGDGRTLVLEDS